MSVKGLDDTPVREVMEYCAHLQPGRALVTFGVQESGSLTAASRKDPRMHMALQYMLKTHLQMSDVVAARLGRSIQQVARAGFTNPGRVQAWPDEARSTQDAPASAAPARPRSGLTDDLTGAPWADACRSSRDVGRAAGCRAVDTSCRPTLRHISVFSVSCVAVSVSTGAPHTGHTFRI